jgi:DNA-directed RNA polymerase I subunit RPA43
MDSSFTEVDTTFSIDLHPSKLRDVNVSVQEELERLLLTYREELHGVVLSYRDERILHSTALVHTFFPYFHVEVAAKLHLFKLQEGQHLGKYFVTVMIILDAWWVKGL